MMLHYADVQSAIRPISEEQQALISCISAACHAFMHLLSERVDGQQACQTKKGKKKKTGNNWTFHSHPPSSGGLIQLANFHASLFPHWCDLICSALTLLAKCIMGEKMIRAFVSSLGFNVLHPLRSTGNITVSVYTSTLHSLPHFTWTTRTLLHEHPHGTALSVVYCTISLYTCLHGTPVFIFFYLSFTFYWVFI